MSPRSSTPNPADVSRMQAGDMAVEALEAAGYPNLAGAVRDLAQSHKDLIALRVSIDLALNCFADDDTARLKELLSLVEHQQTLLKQATDAVQMMQWCRTHMSFAPPEAAPSVLSRIDEVLENIIEDMSVKPR